MGKKVLLVADDDDMNRMIIKKFNKDNFEILEAVDGKQTIEILHQKHVDALLLDIIMPEMDGLEVLETMKKDVTLDHVGVLVATSTKEQTEREALSLGADDIVSKPYDPLVIRKRIENILAVKEIQSQQKLLKEQNVDAISDVKREELARQVEKNIQKILKFTDIIRANKSSYKLVDEIIDNIRLEANDALKVIEKKD